jgi:hypothetical protein
MNETALFKALFGDAGIPTSPQGGFIGHQAPRFQPGTPGYMLQMLFGGGMNPKPEVNPNDVSLREGGVGVSNYDPHYNPDGSYQETPGEYFARMTKMAMGQPVAPAAPTVVKPKVIKPVKTFVESATPTPVAPATPAPAVTPATPAAPATPPNPWSAPDTGAVNPAPTAPEAPAATPAPTTPAPGSLATGS